MTDNTQTMKASKLSTVKTYILIAWIFAIIIVIAWVLVALWNLYVYATFTSYFGAYLGYFGGFELIYTIVFLVFAVVTILVFLRINKMNNAAKRGDVATLKAMNNMLWAILALIFAGVIPGIMLLISMGPINEL